MNLTEKQNEIVQSPLGAALVTAGAGSGKTRVLTHRLAWVIQNLGIKDVEVLALTFTNKAAEEMKKRVSDLLGYECGAFLGTFHSFCARFLRKYIEKLGSPYTSDFSIYNTTDTQKVIKEILSSNTFAGIAGDDPKDAVRKIEWHISNIKNNASGAEQDEILNSLDADFKRAVTAYNEKLKNNNALDFDDLLLKTLEILNSFPDLLAITQQRYKYVLVDEFQDTNAVQYMIAERVARAHGNIMVVGDEDQCIYSWRGASVKNISLFRRDFNREQGVSIYKLEENFRSSKNIVELAGKLVANNSNRIEKVLFSNRKDGVINLKQSLSERDEARDIAEMIAYSVQTGDAKYSDFAVLMRINALSRDFETQFLNYNIPHVVWGGFKFHERAEIKSLKNYLRVICNPLDSVALLDIINWPRRGVGEASIEKISELSGGADLYNTIMNIDSHAAAFPKKTLAGIKNFSNAVNTLSEIYNSFGLFELGSSLISTLGLDTYYDKKKEDELSRLENLYQLEKEIKDFAADNSGATLSQYLQSVSLASGDELTGGDAVTISTVHSAKGLEFKTVFIAGLEDGLFPLSRARNSEAEMEEERRLLYVAITRAREKLYLSHCIQRFMHGRTNFCIPSPFLNQCGFNVKRKLFDDGDNETNGAGAASYNRNKTYTAGFTDTKNEIKAKKDTVESLGFAVGDRVRHEKFGLGTVTGIIDKNIIKVQFETVGVKMLSLAFAAIVKLD